MSFGFYNNHPSSKLPSSNPSPSNPSHTSPLSRRRISTCILEITAHSDRISTLPPAQRHILAHTACQALLARNMSIEPNIYGWVDQPDGPTGPSKPPKVLGDYDHDGKPVKPLVFASYLTADFGLPNKNGDQFAPQCFANKPNKPLIWNHPLATPPITNINNSIFPGHQKLFSINITPQGKHFLNQLLKSIFEGLK